MVSGGWESLEASDPKLAELKVQSPRPKIPDASSDPFCDDNCYYCHDFLTVTMICSSIVVHSLVQHQACNLEVHLSEAIMALETQAVAVYDYAISSQKKHS